MKPLLQTLLVALACGAIGCATETNSRAVAVTRTNYHGWKDALVLRNASVEAVVVPEIGRIMSFRFLEGENVFWEDRSLDGKRGDASGKEWVNFGGDKTWPAPEADWGNYTGRKEWMPPPAFDALPLKAHVDGSAVVLTSPVDQFYGVRTTRRIELDRDAAAMTIRTTYERVSGEPSKIGVWVITQFTDPVAVYVLPPQRSMFTNGYFVFPGPPWPHVERKGDLLEITRDPKTPHKLGSDADQLLWVGEKEMCLVESPRIPGAEYPDRGASGEVYTNPDPKKYIELETLGPLAVMKPGEKITRVNTYTLLRRMSNDPEQDARKAFAR